MSLFEDTLGNEYMHGIISMIYRKCLTISPATNKVFSQGEVVNFITTDAGLLRWLSWNLGPMLRLPI